MALSWVSQVLSSPQGSAPCIQWLTTQGCKSHRLPQYPASGHLSSEFRWGLSWPHPNPISSSFPVLLLLLRQRCRSRKHSHLNVLHLNLHLWVYFPRELDLWPHFELKARKKSFDFHLDNQAVSAEFFSPLLLFVGQGERITFNLFWVLLFYENVEEADHCFLHLVKHPGSPPTPWTPQDILIPLSKVRDVKGKQLNSN